LNNIADEIKGDLAFCKINYLTIIVIGKHEAGKSTLINSVLKVEKAETGTGNIEQKRINYIVRIQYLF
jgi:ABC-type Mn2+/Zn2+ transport system ATPase subunit